MQESKSSIRPKITIASGNHFRTRVVSSNVWGNGESVNWKSDYLRYKGFTYAQVLQRGTKTAIAKKHPGSNQGMNINKVHTFLVDPGKGKATSQPKSNNDVKGGSSISRKPSKYCGTDPVTCYNRYAVFHKSDGVVSKNYDSDKLPPNVQNDSKNDAEKGNHRVVPHSTSTHASENDAHHHLKQKSCVIVQSPNTQEEILHTGADTSSTSKYELPLRLKNQKIDYNQVMASCTTLQLWDKQNSLKVGFIPMGELQVPAAVVQSVSKADPLTLHQIIKASGEYNFKHCQIPIKSQLNPDAWDELLKGYWDTQLPLLIRFGFPLDFDRKTPLESHMENHRSAKDFPQDIRAYLEEERTYDAILGPFDAPPLPNLHTSPFMTRDKPHSKNRRVIVDLSFPQGRSVNAGSAQNVYLNTPFLLKLPTIDHVVKRVRLLGKGCKIYKIDIKRAFRHVKLDPLEYDLLGLRHNAWFLDTCLPFGFRHGSALFQRLSDAVRHMMRQRDFQVINYIDDILGIELPSRVDASFDALSALLNHLGFEISYNKLVKPATCVNCLGILVNTENFTLSIPDEKLQEIHNKCTSWRGRTRCTKRQLQSLLGSLLYVSKCVRSSRFFLNRLLDVLRSMHDKDQVQLSPEAQKDINWFSKFLTTFNGVTIFDHRPIAFHIELDACLQGLGARCGNQVYTLPIPLGYMDLNIVHLEMLNILVALRVWNSTWAKSKVHIACDNEAVVHVLNSGKTRDLTLAAIARNIQLQVATWDINLQVNHIAGKDNHIADLLSRWSLMGDPQVNLNRLLPQHQWVEICETHLHLDWCI